MGFNGVLPWSDAKHTRKKLAYQKVWRYTVQFGVYDLSLLSKLLEDKIGRHEDVLEGRVGGKSRLFDISFNELGYHNMNPLCCLYLYGPQGKSCNTNAAFLHSNKASLLTWLAYLRQAIKFRL